MEAQMVPPALREQLGGEASLALVEMLDGTKCVWEANVVSLTTDRFERRLNTEVGGLRLEMTNGFAAIRLDLAAIRQEMANMRFDLLKWSFVFWIGQVVAIVAILNGFFKHG